MALSLATSAGEVRLHDRRLAAANALGGIGPAAHQAIPELRRAANEPNPDIRDASARALALITRPNALDVPRLRRTAFHVALAIEASALLTTLVLAILVGRQRSRHARAAIRHALRHLGAGAPTAPDRQ